MKKYLLLMLTTSLLFSQTKIVNVNITSLNSKRYVEKIGLEYYEIIESKDKIKFYLKKHIKGIKGEYSKTSSKIKNGKLIKENKKGYFNTYNMKCLKVNNVYFNCVDN